MKKLLFSLSLITLSIFGTCHASSHVEVYAHRMYKDWNTIGLDELEDHLDAETVVIFGIEPNKTDYGTYPSFEKLLLLPSLKNLSLFSLSPRNIFLNGYGTHNPQLSEDQWNVIKSCPIQSLSICLTRIGNIPFDELQGHPTLRHLTIHLPSNAMEDTFIDESFMALNELTEVSLSLSGIFPNVDSLNLLDSITSLNLSMYFQKTHYNGMNEFIPFGPNIVEQLEYVCLPNLKRLAINKEGLKGLRVDLLAPNLEYLDLTNSGITGSTVKGLKALHSLKEVYLGKSAYIHGGLTAGAVRNLSKIPSLRKITLTGQKIKNADFSAFQNLKHLEYLDISGTDITRADLQTLHGLTQLKALKIACLRSMTIRQQDIQEFRNALPDCNVITK